MAGNSGPSEQNFRLVEALYVVLGRDPAFARVRRLMEIDWSEADVTVEEIGLPRLMQNQARKLWSLSADIPGLPWSDAADAIRYTERHDGLARDALWWLGQLASDPLLHASAQDRTTRLKHR